MAKNIKFVMSSGEPQIFTRSVAEQILKSREQLVRVEVDGVWTGYALNKAHIVQTVETESPITTILNSNLLLPQSPVIVPITPEQRAKVKKGLKNLKKFAEENLQFPHNEPARDREVI